MTINEPLFEELLKVSNPSKQLHQIVEETSELNKEICKYFRYPTDDVSNLVEEMGDVLNAIESMLVCLKIDIKEFNKKRHQKVIKYIRNQIKLNKSK